MLSPPIVRAGVARQKTTNSPAAPNRRMGSASRIAPLQLPPINPTAKHTRFSRSSSADIDNDDIQPPFTSAQLQSATVAFESATVASILSTASTTASTASLPTPFSDGASSHSANFSYATTSHEPTDQHAWWLTFESSYHEAQFRLSMRSQSDARLACVVFVVLYAGAIANHSIQYDNNHSLMLQRLLLLLASLLLTAVMAAWSIGYKRYETSRQLAILAVGVCASTLWILAFSLHAAALTQQSQPAAVMLYNALWVVGCRPLLLPYAVLQLVVSCVVFTVVASVDPPIDDTAAQLFFASLCVWLQAVALAAYVRHMDAASRSHYCQTLSLHFLHQHNQQLTSDTRQLKSDFFVLTLERFDIADVEEEGKVLSSAMEQAMGKLQALGKSQQLPPAVLKEIMAVVSLLGSGSDLFKAKMEHTSLSGEDDEMTRYIYETLNGEHNRASNPPTQRSITHPAKATATSTDLGTITEGAAKAAMASGGVMSVGVEMASEVDRSLSGLLAQLEDWNLDLFEVSNMTAGRPLYFIGMALLKRYNCLAEFNLDAVKLSNFLREMEAGYGVNNPYHNSIHAADVARSVHYFIQCGRLTDYCSSLDIFTLIIASLAHDFQHPGKNNAYLVSVRDERALIYNDRSVLENFHTAQTFHLLLNSNTHGGSSSSSTSSAASTTSNCNFLSHLSHKDYLSFRKTVVELVLATDLAHSNEFLGRFKNWFVNATATGGTIAIGVAGSPTAASTVAAVGGNGGVADGLVGGVMGGGGVSHVFQSTGIAQLDNEARLMVMKMALKCADIGHSAKRLPLHEKWTARITEEFYRQGDEERKQSLPISPFMDRRKANLSQSQTGFIDYVCQPLYGAWFKFLDPDERRQREMHDERLRLLRGEWEREARDDGTGGRGGGSAESGSIGSGEYDWVRKRTASQMRLDEEMVGVLEQLKRNREHWKAWQGPSTTKT